MARTLATVPRQTQMASILGRPTAYSLRTRTFATAMIACLCSHRFETSQSGTSPASAATGWCLAFGLGFRCQVGRFHTRVFPEETTAFRVDLHAPAARKRRLRFLLHVNSTRTVASGYSSGREVHSKRTFVHLTNPFRTLPAVGHGGDISDILFDGATFIRSSMAVAIKSLDTFVGTVRNVTYANIRLVDVGQAVMINVYGQGSQALTHTTSTAGHHKDDGSSAEGVESADSPPSSSDVSSTRSLASSTHRERSPRVATYTDIRIINMSGTCTTPGKFDCSSTAPCTGITLSNVNLTISQGGHAAYVCSNAYGSAQGCSPMPCLKT
jgi:hypothetical protein